MQHLLNSDTYNAPKRLARNQIALRYFAFQCLLTWVSIYLQDVFVATNEVYYNSFGEQLTFERIDEIIAMQNKFLWIKYLLSPLMIFIQILLICFCMVCGLFLFDLKVNFSRVFTFVTRASTIFSVGRLIYAIVLSISNIQNVEEIFKSDYFSLLGWIGRESVSKYLWYPLWLINIFQIIFIMFLIKQVEQLRLQKINGTIFILSTYGVGLLFWMLFTTFIQINISV
jgi:hypothetical protein